MVEERQICCCGASVWTKVFAWFQILGNALMLIFEIMVLLACIALLAHIKDEENEGHQRRDLIIGMVAISIKMVVDFIGFFMGIVLLKGSSQRNTSYLQAWLIYAIISLVISVIGNIVGFFDGVGGMSYGSNIIGITFSVIINGFAIWIVRIRIREIDQSRYGDDA